MSDIARLQPTLARLDQAEILPPIAAGKLRRLQDAPASSYAVLRVTLDRMTEARELLQEGDGRTRFLQAPPSGKGVAEDSDNPAMVR